MSLLDSFFEERPESEEDQLNHVVNKDKTLEYSFSLYCFCYNKQNVPTSYKHHINFILQKENIRFNSEGNCVDFTYKRTSMKLEHSHSFTSEPFQTAYNLLKFLQEDLENFGSNSNVIDVIKFANTKYGLDLKYNQVFYLLFQLDSLHNFGDAADFVKFLLEKKNLVYYELDDENRLDILIYASSFQKFLAEKYGEVMFFDTICQTNKNNRVRETVSIQLNNGRIVLVLHCILPNQDYLSFSKVFQIGLKEFLKSPKTF